MSFFKVELDKVVGLIGNESIHTFFKDLSADPFRVKILDFGIALKEVDNDDSAATQLLNNLLLKGFADCLGMQLRNIS
jgi:hypothetical protein